jgi:DNA-directed RNA polymerase subunit F
MKRRVPSKARAKGVPSPTAKHYRNLVRGVLGAAQSNAFSKEAIDRAKLYRNGLRGTLVSARSDLSVDERQEFLTWLQRLSKTGGGQIERALAFDLIVNLLVSSRISLVDEFKWIAARLSPHIDALREFRTLAEQLNCSFWRNEQVEVERLAAKIEEEFGPSIWSIETNLALTQFYHGLEAQKKYAAKIRRAYPKGLPAYISHFVSIRNEDRSTMRVFRHDAIRKIESADVMPRARTYLLYKIADVFTGTASEISAILATEQGQSILDIYETVVDVIQRLVKLGRAKRVSAAVLPLLDVLTAVGDFRVEKLRVSLGAEPTGSLEIRDSHALKHLISGQIATAFRSAKEVLAADPTDIWASFEVALCDALALRPPSVSFGNVWARVQNDISNVMLRREGFEAATGALEKFSRNLRNLHTAAAIGDLNAFCAASRAVPTYSLSSASLNAKKFGPEDLLLSDSAVRPHLAQVMGRIVDDSCIDFWLGRGSQLAGEEHAVAEYLKSLIYYRDGDTATALDVANRAWVNALPVAIRGAWAAVTIDLALARSELDLAIVLIADEAARRPVSSSILPVEFAIDERPWGDLGSHSDKLALAICLHVLWKKTNNELRATHLRFAFEDFITASGCEKPSELGQLSANRSDRLIYFLRFVCIPLVMDQAAIFDSSRDVTEERVAV